MEGLAITPDGKMLVDMMQANLLQDKKKSLRIITVSMIEGLAFGQDVVINGETKHTLFIANDNDFLLVIADPLNDPIDIDPTRGMIPNPNQFYVFAFGDEDLPAYVAQKIIVHT